MAPKRSRKEEPADQSSDEESEYVESSNHTEDPKTHSESESSEDEQNKKDGGEQDQKSESSEDEHEQDQAQDQAQKKDKPGTTRCVPNDASKAALALHEDARKIVKDMGFGSLLDSLLNLQFKVLGTRETILVLMNLSDVRSEGASFAIKVSENRIIDITEQTVDDILDLPVGSGEKQGKGKPKDFKKAIADLQADLKNNNLIKEDVTQNILVEDVIKLIAACNGDPEKQVYLFFCVVVTRLLLPTSSNYITGKTAWMCHQKELMRNSNWCMLVCEHLKQTISDWQRKGCNFKATIGGCTVVLLIRFLDSFLPKEPALQTPRIRSYNTEFLRKTLGDAERIEKIKDKISELKLKEDKGKAKAKAKGRPKPKPQHKSKPPISRNQVRTNLYFRLVYIIPLKSMLVDSLKPNGRLSNFILDILVLIWNEKWNNKKMVSQCAVAELLGKDGRKGFLARELGKNLNKYNTIFFPILDDGHWSLFVVEPGEGLLTLLDSLYSEETATTIHSSLTKLLKKYFSLTDGQLTVPTVEKQKNSYDCGYHMLLYIQRFEDKNFSDIDADAVLRCRQNVLKILLEHPDNKIPMSRFTTNKRSLEGEGEGEGEDGAKKTKVVHERSDLIRGVCKAGSFGRKEARKRICQAQITMKHKIYYL